MTSIRSALLKASVPIQKLMQRVHPPEPKTSITEIFDVHSNMKDGDILLSREAWHFTNMFIPGFWSHAAIYGESMVIEAIAPKVQQVHFVDWAMRKHNWCVLRPIGTSSGPEAFDCAKGMLGALYDYSFTSNNKSFYCSELVFDCWKRAYFQDTGKFTRRSTFGEFTVVPDDFYLATNKIEKIYEHRDLEK